MCLCEGLSDQFCPSIYLSVMPKMLKNEFTIVYKHFRNLKISCIRTYTYITEANAVHSISKSCAVLLSIYKRYQIKNTSCFDMFAASP